MLLRVKNWTNNFKNLKKLKFGLLKIFSFFEKPYWKPFFNPYALHTRCSHSEACKLVNHQSLTSDDVRSVLSSRAGVQFSDS